ADTSPCVLFSHAGERYAGKIGLWASSRAQKGRTTVADLQDGESIEMQGSGAKPYVLKNVGGMYSCTCPAWRNQSTAIERRTCKHLRKLRGEEAERQRRT
ncbi:MAG: hypothetical protein MUF25_23750, partial [Pirellulaceae bacterium]|nr:hypothetical protein [Pirellulaceae bacterium]